MLVKCICECIHELVPTFLYSQLPDYKCLTISFFRPSALPRFILSSLLSSLLSSITPSLFSSIPLSLPSLLLPYHPSTLPLTHTHSGSRLQSISVSLLCNRPLSLTPRPCTHHQHELIQQPWPSLLPRFMRGKIYLALYCVYECVCMYVWVCVCVCVRERERECVRMCVCVVSCIRTTLLKTLIRFHHWSLHGNKALHLMNHFKSHLYKKLG